jgi:phytoene dehydrogenase-like protein
VLATDSVIGAMLSPYMPGSGYVLLHHVMGEVEGKKNAWGYAEGGMGGVSQAIARAAQSYGASLHTDCGVSQILVREGRAVGVRLEDGTEVLANVVLSNATPKVTFLDLLEEGTLSEKFESHIRSIDYTSPVTKINVALSGLPNFSHHLPNADSGSPSPHHQCTIHINCESTQLLHDAYLPALSGRYSSRPMLELCLPSSLDPTLAPPGCHVASIFSQYTPYHLEGGWTQEAKERYAEVVFDSIEDYCPGFKGLVVGKEVLTPPDLERIFGLTGGNIFHGAMSLDQLYLSRTSYLSPAYSSPVPGLFLCGSGAHPGGGVMGSPGRLAALAVLGQL